MKTVTSKSGRKYVRSPRSKTGWKLVAGKRFDTKNKAQRASRAEVLRARRRLLAKASPSRRKVLRARFRKADA